MKKQIRILIVDDHAMMRLAMSKAIERQCDLALVGAAANSEEALKLYKKHRPDVVTMDFKLPGMDGVETTALLLKEFPRARVLMLSIFEGSEDIWRAAKSGAAGYVSKSVEIEEIIQAIQTIADGNPYYSDGLAEKLAARKAARSLSPQELKVLQEIVAGHSNKEIMNELNLCQATVKRHIENIFAKLEVLDRVQAVTAAVQQGIIHLDT